MRSIDIIQFKYDLESYIKSSKLPAEAKRMVVAEIFKKISDEAYREVSEQLAEEKEKNDGSTDQDEI